MAGQGEDESTIDQDQTSSAQLRTRYEMLMRQSRKLGQQAMGTVSEASQSARQLFGQRKVGTVVIGDIEQLKQVIAHSHEVIASATTVFPFIFPDEIVLDRAKITIIRRTFFRTSDTISVRIEDVLNVLASVGPLFGSITISSRVMNSVDHYDISRFWREDALKMKRIMQGYLIARQNGVETDHLSCEELAKTLLEIEPNDH